MKTISVGKLGVFGATLAYLYNSENVCIGECLNTPNCIAFAMAMNENVYSAKDMWNDVKYRTDLADRFWFVIREEDAKIHKPIYKLHIYVLVKLGLFKTLPYLCNIKISKYSFI